MLALGAALFTVLVGHGLLTGLVARIAGLRPKAIGLFAGPKLWEGEVGGTCVKLGLLPVTSYVEFPPAVPESDDPKTTLDLAPRVARLAVALVPWVLLVAPAFVILGPSRAAEGMVDGFVGFPSGGLLFWSKGVALVEDVRQLLGTADGATTAALTVAALTAVNLLPFPGNSGTRALAALLPSGTERLLTPLWALMILSSFGWVVAIVMWAVSG